MSQSSVTFPFTRAIQEALKRRGLVSDFEVVAQPEGGNLRVSLDVHDRLWETALERTRDPLIGLKVGLEIEIWHLDSFGLFLMTHETVHGALSTLMEFLPLISGGFQLSLVESVDGVRLTYSPSTWRFPELRAEVAAGCAVNLCRWMTGQTPPLELSMVHPPRAPLVEYDAALGLPVRFHAEQYEVFFSNEVLALPLIRANARVREQLRDVARGMIAEIQGASVRDQVREILLKDPQRDRSHVAILLGWSPRTLTRRLSDEGTAFGEIRDQVLTELATSWLRQGVKVRVITERLGFSDESAFTKAFRRWLGVTPAEYRRTHSA